MNLTKPTGNLIANIMIAGISQAVPTIGDGATVCYAKDRHACTIISFDEKRKIVTIQQDTAKRTDNLGMSDSQSYDYTRNEQGSTWSFKLKNGVWRECVKGDSGRWKMYRGGNGLILGRRDEFYDYTF